MVKGPWEAERRGLGAWVRDHGRVVAELFDFIGRHAVTSLTVWLLLGIAMALPSALFLGYRSVAAFDDAWHGEPGFSIYLEQATSQASLDELVGFLEADAGVGDVWIVSPAEALQALGERLGDLSAIAGTTNPLPITVRGSFATSSADATLRRITRHPTVDDISSDTAWLERLTALRALLARATLALGVVLGLAAVLITFSSIRLILASRLDELRVMNLVGAPAGYLRRPFVYLGALYGLGGALVGAMLLAGGFEYLDAPFSHFLAQYDLDLEISGFDPIFLGSLFVGGGFLGVVGSVLASRTRLRGLEIAG